MATEAADAAEVDIAKLLANANAALTDATNMNFHEDEAMDMHMADGGDGEDVQFSDADMNDPALLAELAQFEGVGDDSDANSADDDEGDEKLFDEMKQTTIDALKKNIGAAQQKATLFKSANDMPNLKACAACMNELKTILAELSEMDGLEYATDKDEIDPKLRRLYQQIAALQSKPKPSPVATHSKYAAPNTQTQQTQNTKHDEEATFAVIAARYKQYFHAAKQAKAGNDKAHAVLYLRESKVLKQFSEKVKQGMTIWTSQLPPDLQSIPSTHAIATAAESKAESAALSKRKTVSPPQQAAATATTTTTRTSTTAAVKTAAQYATPPMIEERMNAYKNAALQAKQELNIAEAKQYFAEFKQLKEMREHVMSGKMKVTVRDLPPALSMPAPSSLPSSSATTNKPVAPRSSNSSNSPPRASTRSLTADEAKKYSLMTSKLRAQINQCASDARLLVTADSEQSKEMERMATESEMALQKVLQCEKLALIPPRFQVYAKSVKTLSMNADIHENEMRVSLGKLSNVATKGTVDVYCTLKIEALLDAHTSTKRVKFATDFQHTERLKIVRDKKLPKKLKFGRLHLELCQKKLFGHDVLGVAAVKLRPLLESADLAETVAIKPENDRKTVAELEVAIKLRTPAQSEGYTAVEKQFLRITEYPQIPMAPTTKTTAARGSSSRRTQSTIPTTTTTTQQHAQQQQKTKQPVRKQSEPPKPSKPMQTAQSQSQSQTPAKANAKAQANLPDGLTQEMVDDPLAVRYLESFECIMHEIESCTQQITQRKGQGCEGLSDRIQELQTNKSILEAQVSSGLLNLEQYAVKVKQAMIADLKLAKYLKQAGRLEETQEVLLRYKLMKKEMEGA